MNLTTQKFSFPKGEAMQQVAEINGKKVFSDKTLVAVEGTKITFDDGSWCDVATGRVVNKGKGEINIGGSQESEKITTDPKLFTASAVLVRELVAGLEIGVHDGKDIQVVVEGPKDQVDAIAVTLEGKTVVISGGAESSASGGITVVSGRNSIVTRVSNIRSGARGVTIGGSGADISIVGGSVIIGGSGANNFETTVKVKAPKGTSVTLQGVYGTSTIGDTEGTLRVSKCEGDVNVGRVGDSTFNVKGSSDITVQEVNGQLTVQVMGSGDVRVRNGKVSNLTVQVMGSGDVHFGGSAEDANLNVMGSGDISVNNVKNRPVLETMGSGDISVGNW